MLNIPLCNPTNINFPLQANICNTMNTVNKLNLFNIERAVYYF